MFHKVPAYLRCGEVVNNHIKKGLLLNLSDFFKLVNIWQSYKQERAWLSHALCAPGQHTAKRGIGKCTLVRLWLRHAGPVDDCAELFNWADTCDVSCSESSTSTRHWSRRRLVDVVVRTVDRWLPADESEHKRRCRRRERRFRRTKSSACVRSIESILLTMIKTWLKCFWHTQRGKQTEMSVNFQI